MPDDGAAPGGSRRPSDLPPPPAPPQSPPPPPPPAALPPPQQPGRASRGFPWKVLGIIAAVLLVVAVVLGVVTANLVGSGRLTAHVDRANDYLDALRTDRRAAAAMLCPGAQDPNAEVLSTTTGQYLSEVSITNDEGEVTGSVELPDGTTRPVRLWTRGSAFPAGQDPSAAVCIEGTSLR